MALGFTAEEEHAWATCDDGAEFGAGEEAGGAGLDQGDLAAELRAREAEMQQEGESWQPKPIPIPNPTPNINQNPK